MNQAQRNPNNNDWTVEEVHASLRSLLDKKYMHELASELRYLAHALRHHIAD